MWNLSFINEEDFTNHVKATNLLTLSVLTRISSTPLS